MLGWISHLISRKGWMQFICANPRERAGRTRRRDPIQLKEGHQTHQEEQNSIHTDGISWTDGAVLAHSWRSVNLKAAFRGSLSYILPLLLLAKLLSIFSLWHTALTQPVHLPCITPCSVLIPSLQTPTLQRCSFHHPSSVSQASKSLQVGFNSSQ